MKKLLTASLFFIFILSLPIFGNQIIQVNQPTGVPSFLGYVQDEFIVVMKPEVGKLKMSMAANGVAMIGNAEFDAVSQKYATSRIKQQFIGTDPSVGSPTAELAKYHKIKFEHGSLMDAMDEYRALPNVERVEPIGIHALYATPNDTYFDPYQWYHNQTNDDDIDSPEAWNIQTGNDNITLAILDSGVRYYHGDLGGVNASPTNPTGARGNMWTNTAEINGTHGVDDDGNGYVDDWIGYDFVATTTNCWDGEDCGTPDNDPRDFNGHGTHCSGIVGMLTNDGFGMAGVAGGWGNGSRAEYGNGVNVMACRIGYSYRYLNQEVGVVLMDAAAEAFYYAANNGARVASCSWGSSNSGGIAAAADYFIANGGLIFTAAGNDGTQTPSYLASREDVISVAATDQNDAAASFTTYGTWVDISAPGVGIYSTYHDHTDPNVDYWASMDGTSMACPMAAAVSAMIWSQNPTWTSAQVESQLYASAENIDAELTSTYIGKMGAGRINLYSAVNTGPPPAPVANFTGTPTSGTVPLTVNFTDQSTGSIDTWSWTFGDGGTSSSQNPSHIYNSAGTYSVSLTVSGPGGSDSYTATNYITVNPCVTPTAGFVGAPTSGDYPLNVTFTNQSTGATSYSWNFGDGGSSTSANPTHTYTAAGTYTVTQTVTNSCGTDQLVRTNYITVTTPPCYAPVADFSGAPTSGDYDLLVSFTDASTNSPTSWSWTFGDGGTSTVQNPSHTYTAAGTYTVSMTASNSCGSDAVTKTGYITVTEPPIQTTVKAYAQSDNSVLGTFSGTYANTYVSDNVYEIITESVSTNHPVKITSNAEHIWNFNLGSGGSNMQFVLEAYRPTNADGDNFIFEYSTDGATYLSLVTVASATEQAYTVNLSGLTGTVYVKVRDSNRSWGATSLDDVYVDEMYISYSSGPTAPMAEFSGTPTGGEEPLNVVFTDLSTGDPTSWNWTFGDGGSSTSQNPSHLYTSAGTYTVSLSVSNAYGSDVATKVNYITVSTPGISTCYVNSVTVGRQKVGANYQPTCVVVIYDQNGQGLGGATVSVTYDGSTSGSLNGVTGSDGSVSFAGTSIKKPSGEWCFEVTNVTHAVNTYDSGFNVVTRACESGVVYSDGVDDMLAMPTEFALTQNYPNPFNPSTEIGFSLPEASHVTLEVYNILGQQIQILTDRQFGAGTHIVTWDASRYPSGMYFYRIVTDTKVETKKMLLLK